MPLINPSLANRVAPSVTPEVELLRRAGILKPEDSLESSMITQMQEVGLSTKNVLSQLAILMTGAETDSVKLAAIREALKLYMHPAFVQNRNKEDRVPAVIQFQINTPAGAQTQINLGSILRPAADHTSPVVDVTPQNSESW